MKRSITSAIRIVVSFGLLGGLFWMMRDHISEIWATMLSGDLFHIALAVVFLVIMVVMLSFRLQMVFRGEDLSLSLKEAAELTCVGFFFNNFMPTAVGGDIMKAHYAAHFNKKKLKSYASVFMDRIIGMLAILLIAGVALVVDGGRYRASAIRPIVLALLAAGAAGTIAVTNRSMARTVERVLKRFRLRGIGERLGEAYAIVHDYRNRPDVVMRSAWFSVGAQASYCVVIYFLFLAMGRPMNMGNIFLIMPVVIFVSMLPSVGGLGVREYAMVALFSVLAGREVSFAVSLLALSGNFLISIAGGVVYMGWSFNSFSGGRESAVSPAAGDYNNGG